MNELYNRQSNNIHDNNSIKKTNQNIILTKSLNRPFSAKPILQQHARKMSQSSNKRPSSAKPIKPTESLHLSKVSLPQEEIIDSKILQHNINHCNFNTPN